MGTRKRARRVRGRRRLTPRTDTAAADPLVGNPIGSELMELREWLRRVLVRFKSPLGKEGEAVICRVEEALHLAEILSGAEAGWIGTKWLNQREQRKMESKS